LLWQTTNDTRALALDGTGGLFAVGFLSTIRYSGDGTVLWKTNFSASLIARAGDRSVISDGIPLVVIDRDGNATGAIAPGCPDCQWTKLLALKPFPDGQFLLAGLVNQGRGTDELGLAKLSLEGQTTWMIHRASRWRGGAMTRSGLPSVQTARLM